MIPFIKPAPFRVRLFSIPINVMKRSSTLLLSLFLINSQLHVEAQTDNDYYNAVEFKYQTRPNPTRERFFGVIGTTGIKARIYPGVTLKVEEMMPGSPCEGKFAKGEILTVINGTALNGLDPFVAMGNALTKAEASDGKMVFDVKAIGDHTWHNGYNGIACGEYYLRTGDKSVLPIMQHYCDDAKARQKFGVGWAHWSDDINPYYVAGGLMNPAGSQVLTTLLLGSPQSYYRLA